MSVQSIIDRHLSEEGRYQRTITVLREAGQAVVPNNCHVEFYECNLGSLTVGMGCSIHILKSTVRGKVMMTSGQLTIDQSTFNDEIQLSGVKASQSNSTTLQRMKLTGGSLSGHTNTRKASGGISPPLELSDGARAELRKDTFVQTGDLALEAKDLSRAHLHDCKVYADVNGIHLNTAFLEFFGGVLKAPTGYGVFAEENSMAQFTDVNDEPPVSALNYVFQADNSKIKIYNTNQIQGTQTAIYGQNKAQIEIHNFEIIDSVSSHTIQIETEAVVRAHKGYRIYSPSSHVFQMHGGKAEIRDVDDIISSAGPAFRTSDYSSVMASGLVHIIGRAGSGIEAGKGDLYDLKDIDHIQGHTKDGITAGDDGKFILRDIDLLIGESNSGIVLGSSCTLNATRVKTLEGKVGNGITGGSKCKVILNDGDLVTGKVKAIELGSLSFVRINGTKEVLSREDVGIDLGAGSSARCTGYELIEGGKSHGLRIAGEGDVVMKFGGILRGNDGAGLRIEGSGGKVIAHDCEMIRGIEGAGITMLAGGDIEVYDIDEIRGGGAAIRLEGGSTGNVRNIGLISGGDWGVKVGNSTLRISGCSSLRGGSTGIEAVNSSVFGSNLGVSGPASFKIEGGHAEFHECTGDQDIEVENVGDAMFANCTIGGNVSQQGGSLDFRGSSIDLAVATIGGMIQFYTTYVGIGVSATGAALSAKNSSLGPAIFLQGTAAEFYLCSAGSLVMLGSAVISVGSGLGIPVVDGSYLNLSLDGTIEFFGDNYTKVMQTFMKDYSPIILHSTNMSEAPTPTGKGGGTYAPRSIGLTVRQEFRRLGAPTPFTLPISIGDFSVGDPMTFDVGGWSLADSDTSTKRMVGIIVDDDGEYTLETTSGIVIMPNHGLGVAGTRLWLGPSGTYVNTEPTTSRIVQEVIQVIDDDNVYLFPNVPWGSDV